MIYIYIYNYDYLNDILLKDSFIVCYGASELAETHWGGVDTAFMFIAEINQIGDTIRTKEFLINKNELSNTGNPFFYNNGTSLSFGYTREKYLPYLDSTQYGLVLKLDSSLNVSDYYLLEFGQSTVIVEAITIDEGEHFYTISNVDIDTSDERQYHIFFSKIDSAGNVLFNYEIGGNDWDLAYDIEHLDNGNFLISGYTWSQGTNNSSDFYLFEIDTLGNILWEQTYGTPGSEISGVNSLLITKDKEIYMCGNTPVPNEGKAAWLIKTDSVGNLLWEKKYNRGEFFDGFLGIQQAADGNLVLVGSTQNYDAPSIPATGWLLKVDTAGELIWERLVSKYNNQNNSAEYITDMKISQDGYIYFSGYIQGGGIQTNGIFHLNDGWLCKTDSCGFTTGAQPQALLTVDSVVGTTVYISNLSEEYCTAKLLLGNGDSLNIYAYSQYTNGTDPTQLQYTFTDTGNYNLTLYTYAGDDIDTFSTQVEVKDTMTSLSSPPLGELEWAISVYPNPAKNYFILQTTVPFTRGEGLGMGQNSNNELTSTLYTITGQKVHEFTINEKLLQQKIDLPDLNNGVYLLKVSIQNYHIVTRRISIVK